jgi:hypothetical protein
MVQSHLRQCALATKSPHKISSRREANGLILANVWRPIETGRRMIVWNFCGQFPKSINLFEFYATAKADIETASAAFL